MTTRLADEASRSRALTDLGSTLLVEAGAGTGKTALLAGRIAMLLASGAEPETIAAITFTEMAASQLSVRIDDYVKGLLTGDTPPEMAVVLPKGLSEKQRATLEKARQNLDELTCTTIHGFCLRLINPYPVQSGLDPGATPMDESSAELSYKTVFEEWLRERLNVEDGSGDPLAECIVLDPDEGVKYIRSLAEFFEGHRSAKALPFEVTAPSRQAFLKSVDDFRTWFQRQRAKEPETADIINALVSLSEQYRGRGQMSFGQLWRGAHPENELIFTKAGTFRSYSKKGKWKTAAKEAGKPASEGDLLSQEAFAHYNSVSESFDRLLAEIAQELVARFAQPFESLKQRYEKEKRDAALLDFDDLLYKARDLLRNRPDVRKALAERYKHVLVDEYQDTDPLQAEILFRLCGEGGGKLPWEKCRLRPGQLFIVGDPKQSIFRFRFADINTYLRAREAIERQFPGNRLEIVANFRSVPAILDHVNICFKGPLSVTGQAGFAALSAVVKASPHSLPPVVGLDIPNSEEEDTRTIEAERVIALCQSLIGNLPVRTNSGTVKCRPGHIALLAPTGTDLWIYEHALESRGIAIATQAGKGFFRRQEVKDLIAIARIFADGRDTLAFGALMRGPLVGLSEQELLDIIASLPKDAAQPEKLPKFWLWTDPGGVQHPVAAETLRILQSLARKPATAPFDVLNAAVEGLQARATLRLRHPRGAERALANTDLFLEMARPYAARGILAFARDMSQSWREGEREIEGRADAELDALHVITIHSAKGLEWPVVIPINTTTGVQGSKGILYRRNDDTLHMKIAGIEPASYTEVKAFEEQELERERVRLWYVACTRARDLLVLPRHEDAPKGSWAKVLDLHVEGLPPISPNVFKAAAPELAAPAQNQQDQPTFIKQDAVIAASRPEVHWVRPSGSHDDGRDEPEQRVEPPEGVVPAEPVVKPVGSALRGLVLHKLMDEILNGIIPEEAGKLAERARTLIGQLGSVPCENPRKGPCPQEMADTIVTTLNLPIVRDNRSRLLPEISVHGLDEKRLGSLKLVSGVADAIATDEAGRVDLVIDWKSNIELIPAASKEHRAQLRQYMKAASCRLGAVVYMTLGQVDEVHSPSAEG
ncbi:MAG: UvrD-helicase domain-containing protein [Terriglobia bacterium]|jgi:ATP-dependent exoDNAse (exonuclease V) beta subunit